MRAVLDASAAVNVVMRTARSADFIESLENSQLVVAPALFHGEVANTLWKYVRAGLLDRQTAHTRLEEACGLVDAFEPDEALVAEALSLAIVHDHPVYDLLYIVTALRYGARLLSADARLLKLAARLDPGMVM
jgi:predicted nucleic acid-binding protein